MEHECHHTALILSLLPKVEKTLLKRAFTIAGLTAWTLSLVAWMGFAIAGQVTGTNQLPFENQHLRKESKSLATERDSLVEKLAVDRREQSGRVYRYLTAIGVLEFQNTMIIESLRSNRPAISALGPWPREK